MAAGGFGPWAATVVGGAAVAAAGAAEAEAAAMVAVTEGEGARPAEAA